MLNIFNLFLFLFTLWIVFMVTSGHISWLYVAFGVVAAGLTTIISRRLKLIESRSEMLYLSFGFYRHFIKIFIGNFFGSIGMVIDLALRNSDIKPIVYRVKINKLNCDSSLLATSINLMLGLFTITLDDEVIEIHSIDEKYFKNFDLKKIQRSLSDVNDDNLV